MAYDYDTIIIGGGPGGLAAAYGLVGKQKVLVIENNLWGGTCPNFGCDPKKMLYGVVESKRQTQRYGQSGITGAVNIDWPALMSFKRGYTDKIPGGTHDGLASSGIATLFGSAEFVDAHTLRVNNKQVTGDAIIIATGATPAIPNVPGKAHFQTSTDFLSLPELPHEIGFVGAGYVAIELANIAVEAGAKVHVFQHNDKLLRGFPEADTAVLKETLAAKGIQFHWNTTVTGVSEAGSGVIVHTDDEDVALDTIFAAAGRPANIAGLNLDAAGISASAKGVEVNDHLQTAASNVYAIGDVIDKKQPSLTPVSGYEGRYVAASILGQQAAISYPPIPHTVFAGPELAQVGVTVATATAHPDDYDVRTSSVGSWYTYNRLQDKTARVTTIIDKANQQLVGAVVLAVNAEELINTFSGIISRHETAAEAKDWMPVYPSAESDLQYFY
ncbi:dihydrolipoyl dehydrogenase family protein [Secundilactobacillus paracollinoides]|uniref:dihydrolipoyl dehydrogenase family protein n=1 Tax=Secundilactobacillus paracollinoides TaxID=240427 RepID=UPI0006EE9622|nr:NAD(P)/FAD-dependent oxidoreductase [Secundilactobacillus paracollinoides]KRL81522.1 glutathione reductase [Secundilactobacillus paracollinoides DSM 15502 = JCM 11969]